MNELAPLDLAVAGLLANLEPAARRDLARRIAQRLRARNIERIAARQNPDGTAYAPRKPTMRDKRGAIRRAMFVKLRTARWLKVGATPDAAVVAFVDQVQRIAQVHHHGLRDRVNRRGGPEVQYPTRRLIGITAADTAEVEDMVLAHMAR